MPPILPRCARVFLLTWERGGKFGGNLTDRGREEHSCWREVTRGLGKRRPGCRKTEGCVEHCLESGSDHKARLGLISRTRVALGTFRRGDAQRHSKVILTAVTRFLATTYIALFTLLGAVTFGGRRLKQFFAPNGTAKSMGRSMTQEEHSYCHWILPFQILCLCMRPHSRTKPQSLDYTHGSLSPREMHRLRLQR